MSEVATAPSFDPTQPFSVESVPLVPSADGTRMVPRLTIGPPKQDAPPAFDPQQPFTTESDNPQPRSAAQEAGRQLGLTGRYAAEGLTSIPAMVGDAANSLVNMGTGAINRVAGTHIPALKSVSGTIDNALTSAGLPQPETPTERVVGDMSKAVASVPTFAAGAAATGARALEPLTTELSRQATSAAGSAAGAGIARENGAPRWVQILAGLTGGVVGGLRPTDNPEIAQRIAEFKKANITPSVADARQSPFWQWVQKVVGVVPTADSVVGGNETARVGQAAQAAGDIASGYGEAQSPASTGEAAQDAVKNYRFGSRPDGMTDSEVLAQPTRNSSIRTKADVLYSRVPIAPDTPIDVTQTAEALNSAVNAYDNPALAKEMADPRLQRWSDILAQSDNKLSWSDLQRLRTDVRYLQTQPSLTPTLGDRELSNITGALTDDMYNGAQAAGGDRAAQMVQRANQYYSLAMQNVSGKLKSVFNTDRPEGIYSQIQSAISANPNKADIGKLSELQRVMPKDEWGNLAATVIDGLGRPTPGAAIAPDTPQFSAAQFVTRYNQMSPEAKDLLFNGAGQGELKSSLDNLAKVLAYMKSADRYANTSNSANLGSKVAFATAALHSPGKVASVILGANISARAMYNPTFVKLMAQSIGTSPAGQAQTVAQIAKFALENPALANDSRELIRGIATAPAQPDNKQ